MLTDGERWDNEEAPLIPDLRPCQHIDTMNLYCSQRFCSEKGAFFFKNHFQEENFHCKEKGN